jgi:hypothetical protein
VLPESSEPPTLLDHAVRRVTGFPANRVLLAATAQFPCLADGNDDCDSSMLLGRRYLYCALDHDS